MYKRQAVNILRVAVILFGMVMLIVLILFLLMEGRAANLDLPAIYSDPFIIFCYLGSVPFFMVLFLFFKLFGLIQGQFFFFQSR